jgi:hypothetical protein
MKGNLRLSFTTLKKTINQLKTVKKVTFYTSIKKSIKLNEKNEWKLSFIDANAIPKHQNNQNLIDGV